MDDKRYTTIPRLVRDQLDTVIMLPLKDRASLNLTIEENGGSLVMASIDEIRNHLNSKPYAQTRINHLWGLKLSEFLGPKSLLPKYK